MSDGLIAICLFLGILTFIGVVCNSSTSSLREESLAKIDKAPHQWVCSMNSVVADPCFNRTTGEYAYYVDASEGVRHGATAYAGN